MFKRIKRMFESIEQMELKLYQICTDIKAARILLNDMYCRINQFDLQSKIGELKLSHTYSNYEKAAMFVKVMPTMINQEVVMSNDGEEVVRGVCTGIDTAILASEAGPDLFKQYLFVEYDRSIKPYEIKENTIIKIIVK